MNTSLNELKSFVNKSTEKLKDEAKEYNVGDKLPVFIFLDKDSNEIGRLIGEKSIEEIEKYIEELK